MRFDSRCRASLALVAGILGMVGQERLSLMPGNVTMSAALFVLVVSVGLLLFAHRASFHAGYEQARREARSPAGRQ